jgi:hypothetical protein
MTQNPSPKSQVPSLKSQVSSPKSQVPSLKSQVSSNQVTIHVVSRSWSVRLKQVGIRLAPREIIYHPWRYTFPIILYLERLYENLFRPLRHMRIAPSQPGLLNPEAPKKRSTEYVLLNTFIHPHKSDGTVGLEMIH